MINRVFVSIILAIVIISVTLVSAGTSTLQNSHIIKPGPSSSVTGKVEERSTEFSGKSLVFKSLLLAPIGILLLIAVGLLFLPIPAVVGGTGRQIIESMDKRALNLAKDVLESKECVERISCEISRVSKSYELTSWIPQTIGRYIGRSRWSLKVSKGIKEQGKSCRQFSCDLKGSFRNAYSKIV